MIFFAKIDIIFSQPPIAQLAEQVPLKDKVVGSTPTGRIGKNLIGSVAEWLKAPLSKSGMLARASEVRILPLPFAKYNVTSE